jgi:tight adherence protein C
MSGALLGAVLGLACSGGLVLAVRHAPRSRRLRLADRLAPYLLDAQPPRRLVDVPRREPFAVLRRLLGPLTAEAVRGVDRLVGGSASVRRRLAGLGLDTTIEEFRLEQVVWGAAGAVLAGGGVGLLASARGQFSVVVVLAGVIVGALIGVLGRDWVLRQSLARREEAIMAEFPLVADLLALAVVAGEAPLGALGRVCSLTRGALAHELSGALARARAGEPVTRALSELSDRTTVEALSRFLDGLITAIDRGTPLADVLRAQAADVRDAGKRQLLEAGGRKEIAMLVPVVFLIMPITVLFALYPGLINIVTITG